jgi:hypothetical protein
MSVSRASSDTTISATGTFQRRVMRRISGVIVVVATALIIGAVVWVQTTTREDLRQSSEVALAVLTVGLEAEIEEPVREVIGLAVGSTLRNYAHLTSASAEAEFNLQQTELQADVLRSFDELISRRRDRYLAVRYITREGLARGEVINLGTETEVITAPGFTNYWTNAAYVASITQATAGTAFLGPVTRTPDGTPDRLTIYAPVAAVGSMTTTGVIQMEVAAAPVQGVIQAALEAAPVAQPGRRILVLDSANRILADTGGTSSTAAIAQFLGENDGDFTQRFMAGDVALSALTRGPL